MPASAVVEDPVRRDRLIVAAGLAGIAGLSWVYLLHLAPGTQAMAGLRPWNGLDFILTFSMWAVMMVAMMTPSAAPMILLYCAIVRKRREPGRATAASGVFAAGYLVVWTGFSALATTLQWGQEQAALLSPMMVSTSPYLGGALLIAAGAYQMTPLKRVCLKYCRSPVHFLSSHWRKGAGGAFKMGIDQGLFCLGCCWAIMGLLFVGGVMNLLMVAAIAGFILLEKVMPRGVLVGRAAGGLLVLAGIWLIVQI